MGVRPNVNPEVYWVICAFKVGIDAFSPGKILRTVGNFDHAQRLPSILEMGVVKLFHGYMLGFLA